MLPTSKQHGIKPGSVSLEITVDPNGKFNSLFIIVYCNSSLIHDSYSSAEPPSYNSLFGRIRYTHKASGNFLGTIARSITIVIPFCMIVIGSVYFHDCPAEPNIPIFLIVGGSFSALICFIGVLRRVRRAETGTHPVQSLITFFLCCWFITGCVWVYRIYWPDTQNPNMENFCNPVVYLFAFWLITTANIFLGLFTSCIVSVLICICGCGKSRVMGGMLSKEKPPQRESITRWKLNLNGFKMSDVTITKSGSKVNLLPNNREEGMVDISLEGYL